MPRYISSSRTYKRVIGFFLIAVLVAPTTLFVAPSTSSAAVSSWQRSMSMYPSSPTDFGSANFNQTVTHFKSLGFNYITLIIPYYQSNIGSSDVGPGGNTPTDASLVSAIQFIHSQGMGVTLKIHLDPNDGNWRAHINPSDRTTWFAKYKSVLLKYASIASQNGVEAYCIGTELISLSSQNVNPDNTTQWSSLIGAVRSIYGGKVFYDANWGGGNFENEIPQIGFWGALDYIGISAYYNLSGDGSVASLTSDWDSINNSIIRPINQQFGKPILFSEVGYRSVTNAHLEPWNPGSPGSYTAQEQINDYTALIQYWNNYPYMQGIGAWYAVSNPGAGGSGNTDYLIQNKPVEATIQQLFSGSVPPPPPSNASFSMTGSASSPATSGQSVTLTVNVKDQSNAVSGANVDVELYNSSGTQVFQKVFSGQNFSSGQTIQYTANWTPTSAGTYTLKVGVFNGDWSTLYTWNNAVLSVPVSSPSGGGTGGGSVSESIWWPANGVSVSGVQPFKAVIDNMPLSGYSMSWQVDGGTLNPMQDSTQDAPHKEAMVDLTNWTWRGSGPYTINFVAKNSSGTVISSKSVQITVTH